MTANTNDLTQRKTGSNVGNGFVLVTRDLTARQQVAGLAGLARFDAHHHDPLVKPLGTLHLQREIRDVGGPGHTGHATHAALNIILDA